MDKAKDTVTVELEYIDAVLVDMVLEMAVSSVSDGPFKEWAKDVKRKMATQVNGEFLELTQMVIDRLHEYGE